ncbi:hypothetical protein NCC78_28840 [Micromonospora phytophila]|uniref:hypothetical protein n=1 Tax=Micromonospora phytophila TaxID=709888 RepID=UPI00202E0457|nr:hypothetical protein [Micromonospora phytophila]MCM0678649.1 hypothetical protein [Micromonospora phytophila]
MVPGDGRSGDRSSPETVEPWVTRDGFDADPPWGTGEHDPMDEGSEETAVPEGRRGDRRAADVRSDPAHPAGRHSIGSVEPSRIPEAGPGAPPDPAPSRRSFPDDADIGPRSEDALRTRGRRSS